MVNISNINNPGSRKRGMTKSIKLYGNNALDINQGQQFIATVFNVEGRTVVELKPIEKVYS